MQAHSIPTPNQFATLTFDLDQLRAILDGVEMFLDTATVGKHAEAGVDRKAFIHQIRAGIEVSDMVDSAIIDLIANKAKERAS